MQKRVAHAMRYLAGLLSQQTARTNAAEGSATLRKRREVHDDVQRYLQERAAGLSSRETKEREQAVCQAEHNL